MEDKLNNNIMPVKRENKRKSVYTFSNPITIGEASLESDNGLDATYMASSERYIVRSDNLVAIFENPEMHENEFPPPNPQIVANNPVAQTPREQKRPSIFFRWWKVFKRIITGD